MNKKQIYNGAPVDVYQLHIWLKNISPMIWRRLLVRGDTSIADLHHFIQIIMGWEDYNLNQFTIRAKRYGVYHNGGIGFLDNPNKVHLKDFKFYVNERFSYEYNFFVHWIHEIRVEKIIPLDDSKLYPVCVSGKYKGPPEDCGGPCSFMELIERYSPAHIFAQTRKMVQLYLEQTQKNSKSNDISENEEDVDEEDVDKDDCEEDDCEEGGVEEMRENLLYSGTTPKPSNFLTIILRLQSLARYGFAGNSTASSQRAKNGRNPSSCLVLKAFSSENIKIPILFNINQFILGFRGRYT